MKKTTVHGQAKLAIAILSALVGAGACTSGTQPAKLLEPAYREMLFHAVECDLHILDPWRNLSASAFVGRVDVAAVTYPDGRREDVQVLPGALVAVRMRGGSEVIQTQTDEFGQFRIDGLREGIYEFVACMPGFDPDMGWVTISKSGGSDEVVLMLRYGV